MTAQNRRTMHKLSSYSGGRHYAAEAGSGGKAGKPCVLREYPPDFSGTKTYRLNSLGYRGEEFREDAKRSLFFCGCSNTFGTGLNQDEIWINHFAEAYAADEGLTLDDLNVMNFSEDGGSNDYIARTLITQCTDVKPDLAVAAFTVLPRLEYFDSDADRYTHRLGPWLLSDMHPETDDPDAKRYYQAMLPALRERENDTTWELAKNLYQLYSCDMFSMNLARNALLFQYFCIAENIDYLIVFMPIKKGKHPIEKPFWKLLDTSRVFHLTMDMVVDITVDGIHGGAETHKNLGNAAWKHYHKVRLQLKEKRLGHSK